MERREEGGSHLPQAFFLAFRHGHAAWGGQEQGGLGLKGRERSANQGAAIMRGRWRTFDTPTVHSDMPPSSLYSIMVWLQSSCRMGNALNSFPHWQAKMSSSSTAGTRDTLAWRLLRGCLRRCRYSRNKKRSPRKAIPIPAGPRLPPIIFLERQMFFPSQSHTMTSKVSCARMFCWSRISRGTV